MYCQMLNKVWGLVKLSREEKWRAERSQSVSITLGHTDLTNERQAKDYRTLKVSILCQKDAKEATGSFILYFCDNV